MSLSVASRMRSLYTRSMRVGKTYTKHPILQTITPVLSDALRFVDKDTSLVIKRPFSNMAELTYKILHMTSDNKIKELLPIIRQEFRKPLEEPKNEEVIEKRLALAEMLVKYFESNLKAAKTLISNLTDITVPPVNNDSNWTILDYNEFGTGDFLIAHPLTGGPFIRTIIYLYDVPESCKYVKGVVVNKRKIEGIDEGNGFYGGPVTGQVTLTSKELFDAAKQENTTNADYKKTFDGLSSWGYGQLQDELDGGTWTLVRGSAANAHEVIFGDASDFDKYKNITENLGGIIGAWSQLPQTFSDLPTAFKLDSFLDTCDANAKLVKKSLQHGRDRGILYYEH